MPDLALLFYYISGTHFQLILVKLEQIVYNGGYKRTPKGDKMKKQIKTMIVASCLSLIVSAPAFAGWQQTETGQWNYEQDGTLVTSNWVQDEQGGWYYLGADGIMLADTTQNIDGVDYSFDASGCWIEPAPISATGHKGIKNKQ